MPQSRSTPASTFSKTPAPKPTPSTFSKPSTESPATPLSTPHSSFHPEFLSYSATFALGLSSGNTAYGVGAGHLGYNFNNHFEIDFGIVTPNIEPGVANSSNLIPGRVHKSYITAGTLAHFQAGASVNLPHNLSFEADAYEDMPISTSAICSNTTKKKVTTASVTSAAGDNGLSLSLDFPLNPQLTFSTIYDHSIRSQYNVAGFSLTFLPHEE